MLTKNDLVQIKTVVSEEIRKETTPLKKRLKKIEEKLDLTIVFFNKDFLDLQKRVGKLEALRN